MTDTIGQGEGIDTIWSGYTFILGFLIVFRSALQKMGSNCMALERGVLIA